MKLLAVETSSKLCGVSILENEHIIDTLEKNNGLTHSESLMPLIAEILEKNNLKISNFDGFVCDIGPGSFTGIRIGVATIKAFVDSNLNTTFTGVSSLEALAYNSNENGLICSIIDAKNDNCYFALYNLEDNTYKEVISPIASTYSEMLITLSKYSNTQITFIGDGATYCKNNIIDNFSKTKFVSENYNIINPSKLALAGFNRISSNTTLDLSPMYLKKPQAQRQLEEKEKNKNTNNNQLSN